MKTKTKGIGKAHKPNSPTPKRRPKDRGINEDEQKQITNSEDEEDLIESNRDPISDDPDEIDKKNEDKD